MGMVKKLVVTALFLSVMCLPAHAIRTESISAYAAEPVTINCLKSSLTQAMQMGYNVLDGLVEFDNYAVLRPCLATSWEVSEDGMTFTFHLRRNVKWYTCEKEEYGEVTAHDFVSAAKWVLTKANASTIANSMYNNIVGAKNYYQGTSADFATVGIKALDDYTVRYQFVKALPYALKLFTFPLFFPANGKFIKECGDEFGTSHDKLLYCGAYILTEYEPEYEHVLEVNEHYWNRKAITIKRIIEKYNKEASANGPELFLRGEITTLLLPGTILDEWMNDPVKKMMIHPHNHTNMSYFMAFNFEPKYEEEYAPEDWLEAVNNLNFRKSLFHGFDRVAALITMSPYDYKKKILNTYSRHGVVEYDGIDYVMMDGLAKYTQGDSFDKEKALSYKAKAMDELKGKVTFPIKVVMPYNTGNVDNVNRAQVEEQQLENLLGRDYIDIILVPYAASGYSSASRNSGKFSFMELGWGPDFVDPLSSFDPLMKSVLASKWSRLYLARDYMTADGRGQFEAMVEKANKEVKDLKKRYEMMAQAETFLLDNAFVVPFYISGGGFEASYVDPFSGYTGQFGHYSLRKVKGAVLLDKPMNMEEYAEAEQAWLKKRAKELKASPYK